MGEIKCSQSHCTAPQVKLKPLVSILPNDYTIMDNLPKINGVTLIGEKTAQQLSLLSSNQDNYDSISLTDAKANGGYVIVVGGQAPAKISIGELVPKGNGFITSKEIDSDVNVGLYQFVEKKD